MRHRKKTYCSHGDHQYFLATVSEKGPICHFVDCHDVEAETVDAKA